MSCLQKAVLQLALCSGEIAPSGWQGITEV